MENLYGPMGGIFAAGFAMGALFVFGLHKKRTFNSQDSIDLARALTKIEALESKLDALEKEVEPWRKMQEQFTKAALAEKMQ